MNDKPGSGIGLRDTFPPVAHDAWRQVVERDLKGAPFEKRLVTRTLEGVAIQPLYVADAGAPADAAGFPGLPPYARGGAPLGAALGGWTMAQEVARRAPAAANAALRSDLDRGAAGTWLRLAGNGRGRGVRVVTIEDFDDLFADVALNALFLVLDAGAEALPAAAAVVGVAAEQGVGADELRGSLGMDPLGTLARDGRLPTDLDGAFRQLVALASWADRHAPGLRAVTASTLPWHDGGAHAVQELAYGLATGVTYLRRLVDGGLALDAAARQVGFAYAVGRDLFLEIAKLRAARLLWAKAVGAAAGDAQAQRAWIHARTSARTKTARDPWVNLLRTTVECFAAAVGGADVVTATPFDEAIGPPDDFARRIALNTQTVLRHESYLDRVADPGGGSWAIERLTDELARAAWARFQEIEAGGGMAEAVLSGAAQAEVAATAAERRKAVATRRMVITGVSEFPNVREDRVDRPAEADPGDEDDDDQAGSRWYGDDEAGEVPAYDVRDPSIGLVERAVIEVAAGAPLAEVAARLGRGGAPAIAEPVPLRRDAAVFEALRDASDAWLAKTGARPRVFLANMGPIPQHKARAGFSQNLFEAGGFEVLGNDGFATPAAAVEAFAASGAEGAVLCSTDATYPDLVPALAGGLKDRSAKFVALAGRAGEHEAAWRAAGVDAFVSLGCDAHGVLAGLLARLGVLADTEVTA